MQTSQNIKNHGLCLVFFRHPWSAICVSEKLRSTINLYALSLRLIANKLNHFQDQKFENKEKKVALVRWSNLDGSKSIFHKYNNKSKCFELDSEDHLSSGPQQEIFSLVFLNVKYSEHKSTSFP